MVSLEDDSADQTNIGRPFVERMLLVIGRSGRSNLSGSPKSLLENLDHLSRFNRQVLQKP